MRYDSKYVVALSLIPTLSYQFIIHLNTRFVDWPETVFFSWIVSKGLLPHRDFFELHNPGLYYISGFVFRLFGPSLEFLRWEVAALMAMLFFVLLELQFYGNGIWFEQFVAPFLLMAAYVLYGYETHSTDCDRTRRMLLAGVLLGIGAVVKQPVIWNFIGVAFFICFWNVTTKTTPLSQVARQVFWLGSGFAAPLILNLAYLSLQGAGQQYIHSALYVPLFDYGHEAYRIPGSSYVIRFLFWGLLSILFLFLRIKGAERDVQFQAWLLVIFFATSLMFDFPTHGKLHLVPALVFLCVFVSALFGNLNRKRAWLGIVLVPFLIWVVIGHVRFLRNAWGEEYKFLTPSLVKAALWAKENTKPNERIYVLNGAHWHFYFLSERLPASYNTYLYPWMLRGSLGAENILKDLENYHPRLIFVGRQIVEGRYDHESIEVIYRYIRHHYDAHVVIDGETQVYKRKSV